MGNHQSLLQDSMKPSPRRKPGSGECWKTWIPPCAHRRQHKVFLPRRARRTRRPRRSYRTKRLIPALNLLTLKLMSRPVPVPVSFIVVSTCASWISLSRSTHFSSRTRFSFVSFVIFVVKSQLGDTTQIQRKTLKLTRMSFRRSDVEGLMREAQLWAFSVISGCSAVKMFRFQP